MKKRGQVSSFDFIIGVVIFISVLSFFLFFFASKGYANDTISFSVLQYAWFNLEKESFFDNFLINESEFSSLNYDDLKIRLLDFSDLSSDSDFCLFTVSGTQVYHFGPDDSDLEIVEGVLCGSNNLITKAAPACLGNFTAGRSVSKMGFSITSDEFVRITLLVCEELR